MAVSWNNLINASDLVDIDASLSPYSFYREITPAGHSMTNRCFICGTTIENVFGEAVGNGYIYGENGGFTGDNINQNTFIFAQAAVSMGPTEGVAYDQISGRTPDAVIHCGDLFNNTFVNTDLSYSDKNFKSLSTALINCSSFIGANDFGDQSNMFQSIASESLPVLAGTYNMANNTFSVRGNGNFHWHATGQFFYANGAISLGNIVTINGGGAVGPLASNTGFPIGVAAQPGNRMFIPVLQTGDGIQVSKATGTAISAYAPVCPSSGAPSSASACAVGLSIIGQEDGGGASSSATTVNVHLAPQARP
jgi:hypothetical protein